MMAGLSIPVAIYSGAFSQIPVAIQSGNAFYHLLALSAFGSAIAMVLFNILIQRVHILFAASVTYLMPCVSLIVGWLDGEQIGWNDIAGFVFILFGVLIINQVIRWKSTETAV
ncbi:MAG: EamA family transporter [Saprospiraceae bacterium]|nr:EamA family transporter [Saprospiraceae bacterium]